MEAEIATRGRRQVSPVASASSNSTNVPTTLVWMKPPGASMEWSAWLSAARCVAASGHCAADTERSAVASAMPAHTSGRLGASSNAAWEAALVILSTLAVRRIGQSKADS